MNNTRDVMDDFEGSEEALEELRKRDRLSPDFSGENAAQDVPFDEVEGDRGLPPVNDRRAVSEGRKGLAVLFVVLTLLTAMALTYFWLMKRKQNADEKPAEAAQLIEPVPTEPIVAGPEGVIPPPPPELAQSPTTPIPLEGSTAGSGSVPAPGAAPVYAPPPPDPYVSTPPPTVSGVSVTPARPVPRLDKGRSDLMTNVDGTQGGGTIVAADGKPTGRDSGQLASALESTSTGRGYASSLGDRNMTVAKGAMIDCVLQTKIVSSLPGMTSCITTRDIYSDNGRVVLIERGSLVTGEYQAGVERGQSRVFVLWNRVKTPSGVTMDLDSPGSDPLGSMGAPGKVNTHFWQRFGGSLLMSMIEVGLNTAENRASDTGDGGNNVNYGPVAQNQRQLANKVLDNSINIAPTLTKNQGDRMSIFVARDLYFGGVYGLRTRR